jgi:hypothetical protein
MTPEIKCTCSYGPQECRKQTSDDLLIFMAVHLDQRCTIPEHKAAFDNGEKFAIEEVPF